MMNTHPQLTSMLLEAMSQCDSHARIVPLCRGEGMCLAELATMKPHSDRAALLQLQALAGDKVVTVSSIPRSSVPAGYTKLHECRPGVT